MMLKEIAEKCSALGIFQERCITDDRVDIVFCNEQIDECTKLLTSILGPAVKPAGAEPTEDAINLTKAYGNIYGEQTLFKKDFNDFSVIAMFWPWQDGEHTTLKMFLVKK